jgi:hypothetical protein
MWAIYRFLFLLGLLAIDWYFDTSLGQSPLEGPMSSTASVSQSPVHKQRFCKIFEVAELMEAAPLVEAAVPRRSALLSLRGEAGAFILSDAELAYVFMSMQC